MIGEIWRNKKNRTQRILNIIYIKVCFFELKNPPIIPIKQNLFYVFFKKLMHQDLKIYECVILIISYGINKIVNRFIVNKL